MVILNFLSKFNFKKGSKVEKTKSSGEKAISREGKSFKDSVQELLSGQNTLISSGIISFNNEVKKLIELKKGKINKISRMVYDESVEGIKMLSDHKKLGMIKDRGDYSINKLDIYGLEVSRILDLQFNFFKKFTLDELVGESDKISFINGDGNEENELKDLLIRYKGGDKTVIRPILLLLISIHGLHKFRNIKKGYDSYIDKEIDNTYFIYLSMNSNLNAYIYTPEFLDKIYRASLERGCAERWWKNNKPWWNNGSGLRIK